MSNRICQHARYDAAHVMGLRGFFHSRSNIDRIAVNANRSPCVTLLADHHIPAVNADAEAWNKTAKPLVGPPMAFDSLEHCVNRAQHSPVLDRRCPAPRGNQPVAFVEVDVATKISDRLRHIG